MARTRHIGQRISRRDTGQVTIDRTLQFAEDVHDGCVLERKGVERLLKELRALERTTLRAPETGGAPVTTYDVEGHDRRHAHAGR